MAQNTFDVTGGVIYILCAAIELGIFASHLVWRLRTRRLRRDLRREGRTFDDLVAEQNLAAAQSAAAADNGNTGPDDQGQHQHRQPTRWADRAWPPPPLVRFARSLFCAAGGGSAWFWEPWVATKTKKRSEAMNDGGGAVVGGQQERQEPCRDEQLGSRSGGHQSSPADIEKAIRDEEMGNASMDAEKEATHGAAPRALAGASD